MGGDEGAGVCVSLWTGRCNRVRKASGSGGGRGGFGVSLIILDVLRLYALACAGCCRGLRSCYLEIR